LPDLLTSEVPTTDIQDNTEILLFLFRETGNDDSGDVSDSEFLGDLPSEFAVDYSVMLIHYDGHEHPTPSADFRFEALSKIGVNLREFPLLIRLLVGLTHGSSRVVSMMRVIGDGRRSPVGRPKKKVGFHAHV